MIASKSTPEEAERTLRAGLMNAFTHSEGWTFFESVLAARIDGLTVDLCDPTRDYPETQRLRGVIAGLSEAKNLPARIIREAKS